MDPKLKKCRPPADDDRAHNAFIEYIILLQSFCLLWKLVCITRHSASTEIFPACPRPGAQSRADPSRLARTVDNYNHKFLFYDMYSTAVFCSQRLASGWVALDCFPYRRRPADWVLAGRATRRDPVGSWWTTMLGQLWIDLFRVRSSPSPQAERDHNLLYLRKWSIPPRRRLVAKAGRWESINSLG